MSPPTSPSQCREIILGDCLEHMSNIESKSIDLVLTDLPYKITRSHWDSEINLSYFWENVNRIVKDDSAIVLTSVQPFTSQLLQSNPNMFKYEIIWEKSRGSNFIHSKFQPLRTHENILVFSRSPSAYNTKHSMKYHPQFTDGKPYDKGIVQNDSKFLQGEYKHFEGKNESGRRYPRSVIYFSSDSDRDDRGLHPTQKPVALFEYLIKTYTSENDMVLDCCAGSGTTAIACINTNRNYICIEKDEGYFKIMQDRINDTINPLSKYDSSVMSESEIIRVVENPQIQEHLQ